MMHSDESDLHLALVPDGNRRYAQRRGIPPEDSHRIGADRAVDFVHWVDDFPQISRVTSWAISPRNHERRLDTEVDRLNGVYERYARSMAEAGSPIHSNEVDVRVIGDAAEVLDGAAYDAVQELVEATADYEGAVLALAFGYDAGYDVDRALDAARADGIDEPAYEDLAPYFELPPVDIFLRYGEDSAHTSGFAPMQQLRQTTLVFPGTNWPAAEKTDIEAALEQHHERTITEGA